MSVIKRPGEVSISRIAGPTFTTIRIEIMDPETRAMVRADLAPAEFGKAVTGLGAQDASVTWCALESLPLEKKETESR